MSQTANLNRVKNSIGVHVKAFVKLRWDTADSKQFYMRELHDYIFAITQTAPASPDRVLRELRLYGHFDYKVVNRKESLYEITAFGSSTRSLDERTTTPIVPTGTLAIVEEKARKATTVKQRIVTVRHCSPTGRLLETFTAVRKQCSNTTMLGDISKALNIQPGDNLEITDV